MAAARCHLAVGGPGGLAGVWHRWRRGGGWLVGRCCGLGLMVFGVLVAAAQLSYDPADPCWNVATGQQVGNWVGPAGAHLADASLQALGAGAWPLGPLLYLSGLIALCRRARLGALLAGSLLASLGSCLGLALLARWADLSWGPAELPVGGLMGQRFPTPAALLAAAGQWQAGGLGLAVAAVLAAGWRLRGLWWARPPLVGRLERASSGSAQPAPEP